MGDNPPEESAGAALPEANLPEAALPDAALSEAALPEAALPEAPKKKKKKGKAFDPLSDDPIKFKQVGFENALTPEEKAAKKAEKKGAKKKTKKAKPESSSEPSTEDAGEGTELEGEGTEPKKKKEKKEKKAKEGDAQPKEKKGKKGKKVKEGEGDQPKEKKEGETEENPEGAEEAGKGKKKGKKGKAKEGESTESKEKKEKKGKKVKEGEGAQPKEKKGKKKKEKSAEGAEGSEKGKKKGKKAKSDEASGDQADKKGKKGKKGKKAIEERQPSLQADMAAFMQNFATMDDDEWTWESYSASVESVKEEQKPSKKGKGKGKKGKGKEKKDKGKKEEEGAEGEGKAQEKKEGKGKGKKGKKGKKTEEKPPEPEPEPEVSAATDIMAEINKMKALAEAETQGPVEEAPVDEPETKKDKKVKKEKKTGEAGQPKPKKEPKKKLTKKEKEKLAIEMAKQAELEALQAEEDERIRLIEERKANIEKEKRETAEQQLRIEQLNYSLNFKRSMKKHNAAKLLEDLADNQWLLYLKCDGLPNPYVCGEMNTYLHLWEKSLEITTIEEAAMKTNEVLKLLEMLTAFIEEPVGATQTQIDNWKWLYRLFCEHQQQSLDSATYRLLRDINKNLLSCNLRTADFQKREDDFSFSLWVLLKLPTPTYNPKKPPPSPIKIDFPSLNMHALLPTGIDCCCMAVRAMYVKYDHLSSLCSSYERPPCPEEYDVDLNKVTTEEWYDKLLYKYEEHVKAKQQERIEAGLPPSDKNPSEQVNRAAGIIPIVPYRKLEITASTHVTTIEDALYINVRQKLLTTVAEHVINLRKYIIVGGIYFLNLYYQPPQPCQIVSIDMTVTRLLIPKCLYEVPVYVKHNPPPLPQPPPDPNDPEQMEAYEKLQAQELDKLILVTFTLPDHIMWLEMPIVCQWDKKNKVWTTKDVHDLKYTEDNGVTFRTGKFGCFGLATNRFQNLPFQSWEMKPELDGSVTFQITAAILLIEFNIKNNLICVVKFENNPSKALTEIIGVYYKLNKLMRVLNEGGLDFFPAFDAFSYVEGTCEKHWPMEKHLYYIMGQLSVAFHFSSSPWNKVAGRRSVIMHMQEVKPGSRMAAPNLALHITPLKAEFLECIQESESLSEEPKAAMPFYADLYHLMKATSGMVIRSKIQSANLQLVETVANLLINTRILSLA